MMTLLLIISLLRSLYRFISGPSASSIPEEEVPYLTFKDGVEVLRPVCPAQYYVYNGEYNTTMGSNFAMCLY